MSIPIICNSYIFWSSTLNLFVFYLLYFINLLCQSTRRFYILYVKIQNKLPTLQLIARMGTIEAWIMGFKSYVAHPKKPWMSPIL